MKDIAQGIVFVGIALVLFIPLIVSDSMFFPFITGKNFWFRIIVEIVFAAWVILALYDVKYRPRFSWFLPSLGVLLVVMFFANLFGVHPQSSFWSNYERMDGYVTLVHFVMFFVVLGSVLSHRQIDFLGMKTSTWQVFMWVALTAAALASVTAYRQIAGIEQATMGGRMNGTLGNASYMAVYMLFNTFIAIWTAVHTKHPALRALAIAMAVLFAFFVFQTATRGTTIGLAFGLVVGSLFIAIFNVQYPAVRKWALGVIAVVVIMVASLIAFKDSDFVQNSNNLKRALAVNLSELSLRLDIWEIALKGAEERPLLGYGQSNFNYVFNEYYRPDFSWRAEQWYDRAHNVFMDWLVTGGILGLVAYLSIFVVGGYYLLVASFRSKTPAFTIVEYGLLIGIGSAYFVHNLVVFDNLVSFIFFAIILALIHSKVSTDALKLESKEVHPAMIGQVIAPIVLVVAIVVVYIVNIPGMQAAGDIIDAFRTTSPVEKQQAFEQAFSRNGFAQQEITEQMVQQALSLSANTQLDRTEIANFLAASEERLLALAKDKPGDARVHVFLASFYRGVGDLEQARAQALVARNLSPQKPHVILDQGMVEYQAGDFVAMNNFMKESYELSPENKDAQIYYAASLLLTDAPEEEVLAIVPEETWDQFASNNFVLQTANRVEANTVMKRMLESLIAQEPTNPQNYFSLSFVHKRAGETDEAIAVLKRASEAVPAVEATASCYSKNIEAGIEPNTGC